MSQRLSKKSQSSRRLADAGGLRGPQAPASSSSQLRGAGLVVSALGFWLMACASVAPPKSGTPQAAVSVPAAAPPPAPLPPLTEEEARLSTELNGEVAALAAIGPRASDNPWAQADATDHVAARLEQIGVEVTRRGFVWQGKVGQNLEVEIPGRRRGDEVVLVLARLDTAPLSPGADDNASGVAALIALVRRHHQQRGERALRFVVLTSVGPGSEPQAQGGAAYIKHLTMDTQRRIVTALELRGLGYFSQDGRVQRYPESVERQSGQAGFLAAVADPRFPQITAAAGATLKRSASLPVEQWVVLGRDPLLNGSFQQLASEAGTPALLVTDTQQMRWQQFGTAEDTPERLDYERMARAVSGISITLSELVK